MRAAVVLVFAVAATLPLIPAVAAAIPEPERVTVNSSSFACVREPAATPPPTSQDSAAVAPAAKRQECAPGEVAQPRGVVRAKGRPSQPGEQQASPTAAQPGAAAPSPLGRGVCAARPAGALQFHYAGAYDYVVSKGSRAFFTQPDTCVATSDHHSLAELAVQSADGRQIVEVGWTVDRELNGDTEPHLFVYHWVDGQETCYNGCGFVQYSPSLRPGMAVAVTASPQEYSIRSYGANWWISYQSQWIGYFPHSLWGGAFTNSGLVQWFGEVAATTSQPCTDMGNGLHGTAPGAALANSIQYFAGDAAPAITLRPGGTYYSAGQGTSNAFRYGGPGAC